MKKCPYCSYELPLESAYCSHCEVPVELSFISAHSARSPKFFLDQIKLAETLKDLHLFSYIQPRFPRGGESQSNAETQKIEVEEGAFVPMADEEEELYMGVSSEAHPEKEGEETARESKEAESVSLIPEGAEENKDTGKQEEHFDDAEYLEIDSGISSEEDEGRESDGPPSDAMALSCVETSERNSIPNAPEEVSSSARNQEEAVESVQEPVQEKAVEMAQEPVQEKSVEMAQEPVQEKSVEMAQEKAVEMAQETKEVSLLPSSTNPGEEVVERAEESEAKEENPVVTFAQVDEWPERFDYLVFPDASSEGKEEAITIVGRCCQEKLESLVFPSSSVDSRKSPRFFSSGLLMGTALLMIGIALGIVIAYFVFRH